jgi:DNA-binding beta-propeller fold protein YncE
MRRLGFACALSLVLLGSLIATPSVPAAGALNFVSCLSNQSSAGCTDFGPNSLSGAADVVVSPDGSRVYVLGSYSVTEFVRGTDGSLKFDNCTADEGAVPGCSDPTHDSLFGGERLAISPDGQDLYAISFLNDSVSHLRHNAGGDLDVVQCFANAGALGCTDPPKDSLGEPNSLAVSADGDHLYMRTGINIDGGITHFTIGANGALAYASCITALGQYTCIDGNDDLAGAGQLVLSANGQYAYVAGVSLMSFSRDSGGELTYVDCIKGPSGCVDHSTDTPLGDAAGLALDPSGNAIYVSGGTSKAVSRVGISGGSFAFQSCVADPFASSFVKGYCGAGAEADHEGLYSTDALAVTPDGGSVYVLSNAYDLMSQVTVSSSGALASPSCVANTTGEGCAALPAETLEHAHGIAISGDGNSLYVAAENDDAVAHFSLGEVGPPADGDGDGVFDAADACPAQAGPASNGGCPLPAMQSPPLSGGGAAAVPGAVATPVGVSGACISATKALATAKKKVATAKKAKAKAKTEARKKATKATLKKANAGLKKAKTKKKALC